MFRCPGYGTVNAFPWAIPADRIPPEYPSVAINVLSRHGCVFKREANVVGDEQIKMAITVVVQKTAPGAPSRLIVPEAGSLGHIGKGSVPIVAVEVILSEAGAEDVFESVVVVIADAHRRGPVHRPQSRFVRNVGKRTVTIVLVEVVSRTRRGAFQASAGEQENIHPAIVIVVEESAATACGFQNVLLAFHTSVDRGRGQSRGGSDIHEVGVERTSRRSGPGYGFCGMGGDTLREQPLRGCAEH